MEREKINTYKADEVAKYFIYISSEKNIDDGIVEGITPLKMQKLLYFSQAVALSLYDQKLFEEEIEAWKYGPVVSNLYKKYRNNQNLPIKEIPNENEIIIDSETRKLIEGVWSVFGKYSASKLVDITHNHKPWKETFKENKNLIISTDLIKSYYKNIFSFKN